MLRKKTVITIFAIFIVSNMLWWLASIKRGEVKETRTINNKATWHFDRGNRKLSGEVDNITERLEKKWSFKAKGGIYSSGVVVDYHLYVADELGNLYCLDLASGQVIWEHKFDFGIISPLVYYKNSIYFGDANGVFYRFDINQGKIIWKYTENSEQIVGAGCFNQDFSTIYLGSYDFCFRGLDVESGREVFKVKTNNYINGSAALAEDKIIFGGCDSRLRIIGLGDGKLERIKLSSYIPNSVAVYDNMIYVATYDGCCYSLNVAGETLWQYSSGKKRATYKNSPAVNEEIVVVAEQRGSIALLNRQSGEKFAELNLASDIESSPLIDKKNGIIVDVDGVIYIFSLKTGEELFRYNYGTNVTMPLLVNSNMLIIGDEDGNISRFNFL